MNLPDSAITFLDAFRGIYRNESSDNDVTHHVHRLPMIHCHCFTRQLDQESAEGDIRKVRGHVPFNHLCF
jgi:tRNA (guanine37-N1)-methyltransferase